MSEYQIPDSVFQASQRLGATLNAIRLDARDVTAIPGFPQGGTAKEIFCRLWPVFKVILKKIGDENPAWKWLIDMIIMIGDRICG